MKEQVTWEHQRKRVVAMVIGLTFMAIGVQCGGFALERGAQLFWLGYAFSAACFLVVLYEMAMLFLE